MKDVIKFVCVLIIDVCVNCCEIHVEVFLGGVLCTGTYGCIFVCIVV